ncbi:MAG: hypothetical protein HY390_07500 [Deltaproteobacteria bacterium]|nr:hypothetical protein [Deltaproteobacteria bacterium]
MKYFIWIVIAWLCLATGKLSQGIAQENTPVIPSRLYILSHPDHQLSRSLPLWSPVVAAAVLDLNTSQVHLLGRLATAIPSNLDLKLISWGEGYEDVGTWERILGDVQDGDRLLLDANMEAYGQFPAMVDRLKKLKRTCSIRVVTLESLQTRAQDPNVCPADSYYLSRAGLILAQDLFPSVGLDANQVARIFEPTKLHQRRCDIWRQTVFEVLTDPEFDFDLYNLNGRRPSSFKAVLFLLEQRLKELSGRNAVIVPRGVPAEAQNKIRALRALYPGRLLILEPNDPMWGIHYLMIRAKLFITIDSGLAHIGSHLIPQKTALIASRGEMSEPASFDGYPDGLLRVVMGENKSDWSSVYGLLLQDPLPRPARSPVYGGYASTEEALSALERLSSDATLAWEIFRRLESQRFDVTQVPATPLPRLIEDPKVRAAVLLWGDHPDRETQLRVIRILRYVNEDPQVANVLLNQLHHEIFEIRLEALRSLASRVDHPDVRWALFQCVERELNVGQRLMLFHEVHIQVIESPRRFQLQDVKDFYQRLLQSPQGNEYRWRLEQTQFPPSPPATHQQDHLGKREFRKLREDVLMLEAMFLQLKEHWKRYLKMHGPAFREPKKGGLAVF